MPIYEYKCRECGDKFEKLVRTSNAEKDVKMPGLRQPDRGAAGVRLRRDRRRERFQPGAFGQLMRAQRRWLRHLANEGRGPLQQQQVSGRAGRQRQTGARMPPVHDQDEESFRGRYTKSIAITVFDDSSASSACYSGG